MVQRLLLSDNDMHVLHSVFLMFIHAWQDEFIYYLTLDCTIFYCIYVPCVSLYSLVHYIFAPVSMKTNALAL